MHFKPGDFVQTNEIKKKYLVVESFNPETGGVTCIWFNEDQKIFERIYIFAEDLVKENTGL